MAKKKDLSSGDIGIMVGRDENVRHLLRRRGEGHPIEMVNLKELKEGQPITGEVLKLSPKGSTPFGEVFDIESVFDGRSSEEKGPTQVANEAYRKGWDAIFGGDHRGN